MSITKILYTLYRYDVMVSCWDLEPGSRPKFSDLVVTVNDLLESYAGYLELSLPPTYTTATSTSQTLSRSMTELTNVAEFEPQLDGKEGINDNLQDFFSPSEDAP